MTLDLFTSALQTSSSHRVDLPTGPLPEKSRKIEILAHLKEAIRRLEGEITPIWLVLTAPWNIVLFV